MHPPARSNRSYQTTGTPGASRTQALAGGHRAAAVAVRVPSPVELAPRSPARPAVPAPVQLNPAEMGVLAAQQMFAYVQAQLALPQQQRALGAATICATVHPTDVNTLASINASRAAAPLFQRRAPALLQHGSPAALPALNASPAASDAARQAARTFVCVFNFFCAVRCFVVTAMVY